MKELRDLELLLTAHTPIIVIESIEEIRAVELFARLALKLQHPFHQWTVTEGLKRLEIDLEPQGFTADPTDALKHIKALSRSGYFLMLDFHPFLTEPIHVRLIKEIAQNHENITKTLIFLSYSFDIPSELRHLAASFELHLPDQAGIKTLIREEVANWQRKTRRKVSADAKALDQLTQQLSGMTATDAKRMVRTAIEDDGAISHEDLPNIMKAKYELLGREGVISFEYDTANFSDVAGLTHLKEWLSHRHKAFTGKNNNLDQPKGILLLGVQGGGKSLAAKAVAGTFGVPLLRLDFGALYNKYYGETEKNLRHALQVAEMMEPCVVWMDEIEKGIAHSGNDEGLSQRVLGTLLTWMAEHDSKVFIVATANDIEKLPPELMRKGRLDEIFFVDLPKPEVRREIFQIHLRRRNLAPSGFNLEALGESSEGFTGAEIEQAVVSALYAAHAQNTQLTDQHLLQELARTKPLSVVMAEKIEYLRSWARERTVLTD